MDIQAILDHMTLEEKIRLCSGKDVWHLEGNPALDLPSIRVSDGPHGLRKQTGKEDHLGLSGSQPATAFPTASLSACSWDKELLFELGQTLGDECRSEEVAVLLGPGVNMKRSPLCGRNFEYFSEDPVLSGELAAAFIDGVQSKGVGTSLKHFAANNQEHDRMTSSSNVDDRALREYYLLPFEIAVRKSRPWTLMCSYNKINGVYSSANAWLLDDVLRKEWGFEGVVVSDWGAGHEHWEDLKAGMDLEMPGNGQHYLQRVVEAVAEGKITTEEIDRNASRILSLIEKAKPVLRDRWTYDLQKHHQIARKVANQSIVLLKNEGKFLPLKKEKEVLVLGELAKQARIQGGGSSHINPHRVDSLCDAFDQADIAYAYRQGYDLANAKSTFHIPEAIHAIQENQNVIVVVGLRDEDENEGFDRKSLALPYSHDKLVAEVAKKTKNLVVVLAGGSPVEMPWVDQVASIVNGYLPGEAGGLALRDLLFGDVNPSGKLAESYPRTLSQVPCSDTYGKERKQVHYRESVFVGYRYYDSAKVDVLFPFGHGLSYTTFEYSALEIEGNTLRFNVRNSGTRIGSEIIQVYVSNLTKAHYFAAKELKAFEKIHLGPRQEKTVEIALNERDFMFYHPKLQRFVVASGEYEILIGASSQDIRLSARISKEGEADLPKDSSWESSWYAHLTGKPSDEDFNMIYDRGIQSEESAVKGTFTIDSTLEDMGHTLIGRIMKKVSRGMLMKAGGFKKEDRRSNEFKMMFQFVMTTPLRTTMLLSQGQLSQSMADGIVDLANGKYLKGLRKFLRRG